MTSISGVYPLTLEQATDIAIDLKLSPLVTHIGPSRYRLLVFDDLSTATMFRLRFNAVPEPTTDPNLYAMLVSEQVDVDGWLRGCGSDFEEIEFTVVGFGSAEDQERFERLDQG